ncbi:MAG: hypothetical protein AB1679_35520 [Actinomycetota bacterium]
MVGVVTWYRFTPDHDIVASTRAWQRAWEAQAGYRGYRLMELEGEPGRYVTFGFFDDLEALAAATKVAYTDPEIQRQGPAWWDDLIEPPDYWPPLDVVVA